MAVDRPWAGVDIPLGLADTVVGHTVVVDIATGHRLAVVVDIVADRKVAAAVGIAVGCTIVAGHSRVAAHTGMDMAVVVDTVEKIAQVAYRQFVQVALEWLSQAACHNWNRNAHQVRPAVHN